MSYAKTRFELGFYCRDKYKIHHPWIWGPLGEFRWYWILAFGNIGHSRRHRLLMAYGGSLKCKWGCGCTFSWYTGKNRKGFNEARDALEDHEYNCIENPKNKDEKKD